MSLTVIGVNAKIASPTMANEVDVPSPPTACRTGGQRNKSLKLAIGKEKLCADPAFARSLYQFFILNGIQYCRPHMMVSCHLCMVNNQYIRDEVDEERIELGIRLGGDPRINQTSDEWTERIQLEQMQFQLEDDTLKMKYRSVDGEVDTQNEAYQREWRQYKHNNKAIERRINDEFLAQVHETLREGASQCCYYACAVPNADKLLRCKGCGIATYCSKEHQKMDWMWEHKGECTSNVPKIFLDEIKEDRQRHLSGDYSDVDRD